MDASGDLTVEDVGGLRVVDLKEALKKRDLPTDGKKAILAERLTEALEREGAGAEGTQDSDKDIGAGEKEDEPEGVCAKDKDQEEMPLEQARPVPMDVDVDCSGVVNSSGDAGSDPHEAAGPNGEGSGAVDACVNSSLKVPGDGDGDGDASSGVAAVSEPPAFNVGIEAPQLAEVKSNPNGGDLDRDIAGELESFMASMEAELETKGVDGAGKGVDEPLNQTEASATHGDGGVVNGNNSSEVSATGNGDNASKSGGSADAVGSASGIEVPFTNADKGTAPSESVTSPKPFMPTVIHPNTSRAPSNSQDTYAYEEEQERLAMLKSLHRPMRQWFNEDSALKEKHGSFPMFWQDLASWPPMRELKRMYLVAIERKENPDAAENDASDEAMPDVGGSAEVQVEATSASSASTTAAAVNGELMGNASGSSTGDGDDNSGEGGKKKRKKRWGEAARKNRFSNKDDDEAGGGEGGGDTSGSGSPPSKARKSRWSSEATNSAPEALPGTGVGGATGGVIPGMPVNLSQEQIQETLVLQVRLTQANEKLATVDQDAIARSQDPDRSPSPPPRYDSNGVRTNPRNVRMREALNRERNKVIEEMMKLNPMFRPPPDFVKTKPNRKLYIPTEDYPGYNFIGLIIGPRGNTQKRMERETDCKIAIRGKGSVKEGARRGPTVIDEDDELHVYISGETEEAVEKAAKEVGKLLRPLDDEQNEHKQKQLRELALINGTLREEDYCNICGDKGHRQFECPKRAQTRSATVEVRCALCGDTSHPTRDCLLHKSKQNANEPGHEASLDKEYLNFMAELGDGDSSLAAAAASASTGAGSSASAGGDGSAAGSGSGSSTSGGINAGGGSKSVAGNGGGSSSSTGTGKGTGTGAAITNHYVWTPPTSIARPGVAKASSISPPVQHQWKKPPAVMPKPPHLLQQPPLPPSMVPSTPPTSSGQGGAQSQGMLPPGPPPPIPPRLPPAMSMPPPLPRPPAPPQLPKATGNAPAPGTGAYSFMPPPMAPQMGYSQQQHQASAVAGYGYPPIPPMPTVGAMAWGAPPPLPPVPPSMPPPLPVPPPLPPADSGGYVPPPLPPAMPSSPPPWPPSLPQGFQPPLPTSDSSGTGHLQTSTDVRSINGGGASQFFEKSPPLPPPPLPGQPPLPPG